MYHVKVKQDKDKPFVLVRISFADNPRRGAINAIANVNSSGKLKFYVNPDVTLLGSYTANKAEEIGTWWRIAAQVTRDLERLIVTRDDMRRTVTARVDGSHVLGWWAIINFGDSA